MKILMKFSQTIWLFFSSLSISQVVTDVLTSLSTSCFFVWMYPVLHVVTCPCRRVSHRRQHSDYSPQVAKYPRLESYSRHYSPYPAVRNTLPPPPHPHRPHPPPPPPPPYPNHAVAGPSRSDFSHFNSSSQASPQPRVPALPKSHNSLQAYARDEVAFTSPSVCSRTLTTGLWPLQTVV